MAMTRRNAMQIEEMRALINTERIVNRLQAHIVNKVKMRESQVRAALGLLRKVLPDLSNVELQAGSGGPILIVTGIMRPGEQAPAIEQTSPKVLEHVPAPAQGTPQAVSPTRDAAHAKPDSTS